MGRRGRRRGPRGCRPRGAPSARRRRRRARHRRGRDGRRRRMVAAGRSLAGPTAELGVARRRRPRPARCEARPGRFLRFGAGAGAAGAGGCCSSTRRPRRRARVARLRAGVRRGVPGRVCRAGARRGRIRRWLDARRPGVRRDRAAHARRGPRPAAPLRHAGRARRRRARPKAQRGRAHGTVRAAGGRPRGDDRRGNRRSRPRGRARRRLRRGHPPGRAPARLGAARDAGPGRARPRGVDRPSLPAVRGRQRRGAPLLRRARLRGDRRVPLPPGAVDSPARRRCAPRTEAVRDRARPTGRSLSTRGSGCAPPAARGTSRAPSRCR